MKNNVIQLRQKECKKAKLPDQTSLHYTQRPTCLIVHFDQPLLVSVIQRLLWEGQCVYYLAQDPQDIPLELVTIAVSRPQDLRVIERLPCSSVQHPIKKAIVPLINGKIDAKTLSYLTHSRKYLAHAIQSLVCINQIGFFAPGAQSVDVIDLQRVKTFDSFTVINQRHSDADVIIDKVVLHTLCC